jgi:hypothetical protein
MERLTGESAWRRRLTCQRGAAETTYKTVKTSTGDAETLPVRGHLGSGESIVKPTLKGRFPCLLEGAESIMRKNQPKQVPEQKPAEDEIGTMGIFMSLIEWVWDQLDLLCFTVKHQRFGLFLALLGFVVGCLPAPTILVLQKVDWHMAAGPLSAFIILTFVVGMGLMMLALYVGMQKDRR